jgi:hypothetical protein
LVLFPEKAAECKFSGFFIPSLPPYAAHRGKLSMDSCAAQE